MELIKAELEIVTAGITLVTVIIALVVAIRSKRQVKAIYVLANRRMDETLGRVDQLIGVLVDAGIDVPPDLRGESPDET